MKRAKYFSVLMLLIIQLCQGQTNSGAIEVIETDPLFRTPKKTLPYDREFILKIVYDEPIDVTGFAVYEVQRRFADDLHERVYPAYQFKNRHKAKKSDDGKKYEVYLFVPPLRPGKDYEFMILSKRDEKTSDKDITSLLKKLDKPDYDELAADFTNNNKQVKSVLGFIAKKANEPEEKREGTKKEPQEEHVKIYKIEELYPQWKESFTSRFSFTPRKYIRQVNYRGYKLIEDGNEIRYKPLGLNGNETYGLDREEVGNAFNTSEEKLKQLKTNNDSIILVNNFIRTLLNGYIKDNCENEVSELTKAKYYAELISRLDTMCKQSWSISQCKEHEKCAKQIEGKVITKECESYKDCKVFNFQSCCGEEKSMCEVYAQIGFKNNYCDLRYLLDSLNKDKAELTLKIRNIIAQYVQNAQYVKGSTNVIDLETRNKVSISPDFGWVFYGMPAYNFRNGFNGLVGYGGLQFEFRYTSKDVPFWKMQRKTIWHFLSASVGLTYTPIGNNGKTREDLIAGKTSLLTGIGIRLSNTLRITTGGIWFYRRDTNPLVDKKYLTATPYIGLSLDISLRAFFNEFIQIGALIKDMRRPRDYTPMNTSGSSNLIHSNN